MIKKYALTCKKNGIKIYNIIEIVPADDERLSVICDSGQNRIYETTDYIKVVQSIIKEFDFDGDVFELVKIEK